MSENGSGAWPSLPIAEWRATHDTLHLWLQVVGKVRLALSPHVNHWWETPLYVWARGLTTSPIPWGGGVFEIRLDFLDHELLVETSGGGAAALPLRPMPVAEFYAELMGALRGLGIDVRVWPVAVELQQPVRLDEDRAHAAYDAEHVARFWRALVSADTTLKEFRARFVGKDSPVHFFWGSFDLAATRFSGRRAPPRPGADFMTREAYSHEVLSAGWWPGGRGANGLDSDAVFYAYAAPEPDGFAKSVRGPGFYYDDAFKEFLLPYDKVRCLPDPKAAVLDFLQRVYEAGAALGGWDRAALERPRPWPTA